MGLWYLFFSFQKRFRYRWLRLKPKLTDEHEADRLAWYFNYRYTHLTNYVFGNETTIRQIELP